jgi:hypothetical protein
MHITSRANRKPIVREPGPVPTRPVRSQTSLLRNYLPDHPGLWTQPRRVPGTDVFVSHRIGF